MDPTEAHCLFPVGKHDHKKFHRGDKLFCLSIKIHDKIIIFPVSVPLLDGYTKGIFPTQCHFNVMFGNDAVIECIQQRIFSPGSNMVTNTLSESIFSDNRSPFVKVFSINRKNLASLLRMNQFRQLEDFISSS